MSATSVSTTLSEHKTVLLPAASKRGVREGDDAAVGPYFVDGG